MTGVALSEMLGVTPQAVHNYEFGRSTPSPAVLQRISSVLNLPEPFFSLSAREVELPQAFYRSLSSATKSARTRAEHKRQWTQDITEYLEKYVKLPEVNLPRLDLPADPLLISEEEVERAAEDARSYWRMLDGPISNTVLLLENQGVVVARDSFGAVTLDGLSVVTNRPYVLIGTDKGTAVRWRFDAAHELGHLLLHRELGPETVIRHSKLIEQQAHRFAAAFLLPMASFGEDLFSASLDAMRAIKPKWKVSIAMMIMRAKHGSFISDEIEKKLWVNYSRRGWRRSEPYDDLLEAEQPQLLQSALKVLAENGHDMSDLVQSVGLSARDIETLCSLPPNYLSQVSLPRVALRVPQSSAEVKEFEGAKVYPFKRSRSC